jgi:hypothetical protein
MKRVEYHFLVAAITIALSCATVNATPVWWDDPDFQTAGAGRFVRLTAEDPSEGSLVIHLGNVAAPTQSKEVYFVLEWNSDNLENARISPPVTFCYPPDYGIWEPGTLVVDDSSAPYRWEYSYTINPQPAEEWAKIEWYITVVGPVITYSYDMRSHCSIPEPASVALLGLGGLALLAMKRRRG